MQKSVLALVTLTTPEGCFLGTTAGRELARKTTESPPPLEGALFSLESINLCFLYPTYLLLILSSTFATSLCSRAITVTVTDITHNNTVIVW